MSTGSASARTRAAGAKRMPAYAALGAPRAPLNRAGHSVALGAASRGQPLRRAPLGRALRARPPRGRGRALGLARPRPRGPGDGPRAALEPGRPVLGSRLRVGARGGTVAAVPARRLGVAAAGRVTHARGAARPRRPG